MALQKLEVKDGTEQLGSVDSEEDHSEENAVHGKKVRLFQRIGNKPSECNITTELHSKEELPNSSPFKLFFTRTPNIHSKSATGF